MSDDVDILTCATCGAMSSVGEALAHGWYVWHNHPPRCGRCCRKARQDARAEKPRHARRRNT